MLRAIRGATTTALDDADAILEATRELLLELVKANKVETRDIAAALFTVTPDLKSAFPAAAARQLGWRLVPLLDSAAPAVHDSLPRCVRVMLLWNTHLPQEAICHVYLRDAKGLRPDLSEGRETGRV